MRRDSLLIGLAAALMVAWLAVQVHRPGAAPDALGVSELLGGDAGDYLQVTGPRPLEFPADHAMHPGYRNEWWYFTGNLAGPQGERLGWQFTLFRFALKPDEAPDESPDGGPDRQPDSGFAADAVWMAHLAVSDGRGQRFHSRERVARGALELAGATPRQWWLKDWTVQATDAGWRVEASAGDFAVDLELAPLKPVVLQGDRGYSRKGPEPGNASRYYSITRIATRGNVEIDGQTLPVTGISWLDREWGSSQLGEDLEGWDWFALQLDDGRDLMVYRLRRDDGTASEFSAGLLVDAQGRSRYLAADDFAAAVQRNWRDQAGVRWPVEWTVRVPGAGLELEVRPLFDGQRWSGAVDYWEGAVEVLDGATGQRVGRGYLELSGYAG